MEIVLGYPGEPIELWALQSRKAFLAVFRERHYDKEGSKSCGIVSFEGIERGSRARNVRSLKSGKGKEMDSSKETPERNAALTIPCS